MFDEVRDLYNQTILARGRNPLHMQPLADFDATAKGDNPMCGDRVEVWVKLAGDGSIANTGYKARGCEISVVSADLMVEAVQGLPPASTKALFEAFRSMVQTGECPDCAPDLTALQPLSAVHNYKSRVKCATLPWHALIAALDGSTTRVSSE
jgi:nitrogen fixation NifU-like protein